MTDSFGNQPPENFPPNENPAQQPPADQFGAPQQGFPAAQQPPADQFGAPQQGFPAAQQPPADQFGAPQQGYPQQPGGQFGGGYPPAGQQENKKLLSGILGILLGSIGVHKFMLGYTTEGIIMAAVTLLTCGAGYFIMGPIGLIEGIIYLTKSDEEFYQTYQVNKKGWF